MVYADTGTDTYTATFIFLRVVINVLTNLKRFHRPVSSSLSI